MLPIKPLLPLTVILLQTVTCLEGNAPYIEILRGRDGRDGRDGATGPQGPRGPPGATGLTGEQGQPGRTSAGVPYTRWGKASCPDISGTELLYDGITAGSWYNHHGGASNYLCLPKDPEFNLGYKTGTQRHSQLYGTEYEDPITGTQDYNVPCAVCYASTREAMIMIPAKTTCPQSWTREYYGYLMSANNGHNGRTMFECVDKDQESLPGHNSGTDGALFYHVEVYGGYGLTDPPYDNTKELTCVVCTK